MKKLLIVHTGGTLGMTGGEPTPLRPEAYGATVHRFVPELRGIADIDFEILFNLDSSDLQPEQIEELAKHIERVYTAYDGFVVIHGTDTMAYSASALAFLLRGLGKPVILTGSQRPLSEIRSDAKSNLIAACVLASDPTPIPEVGVFFGTVLLRGCRTTKVHTVHLDAFASPNCPPLANVGLDIERGGHIRPPGSRLLPVGTLAHDILAVRLLPGLDAAHLIGLLAQPIRGIVLEAFGLGNVPVRGRPLEPFLQRAASRGVPIVLTTQCLFGGVRPELYEGGRLAVDNGVIAAGDMTIEAAAMKLAVLLGDDADVDAVRAAFASDWAGERTPFV